MTVGQDRSNYLPFHFAVPAPTSLMLSSSIPSPIPPFGSNVTLTCAVELSPAVDVPVTVNTALTPPDGFTRTSTAQPVMGSSTNYTSTAHLEGVTLDTIPAVLSV